MSRVRARDNENFGMVETLRVHLYLTCQIIDRNARRTRSAAKNFDTIFGN